MSSYSEIEPWVAAAQTIARHCGRSEPDASDYRAVAKAAFHNNDALRAERDEAVALLHQTEDAKMALRKERDEAVALLREVRNDGWGRDLDRRIDAFLAKLEAKP